MFWGLILESGKRYSTTVERAFHISMATLDCSSVKTDSEVLSVMLEGDEQVPYILCNLNKSKMMHSPLDLNFMTGDSVTFFCKGSGTVHLSGYILVDDDDLSETGLEEEDEEEEDWEEAEGEEEKPIVKKEGSPSKGKKEVNGLAEKRKSPAQASSAQKKVKLAKDEEEEDEEDNSEEEDSDDEMMEGMKSWAAVREGDSSGDEEEESDDDMMEDDEEDEEEEDSDEASEKLPPTLQPASEKKQEKKKSLGGQKQTPGKQQQQTPGGKQQQTPGGKQQQSPGNKGQKTPNGLPGGGGQSGKKEKKKGEGEGGSSPQKKALEGGVTVKDIAVGNGPVCKPGKMATVYYVGRLKSTNKVFDSASSGPGFKFRVGRGEVIKGWDVGLQGMKVGGKRVITCPPHMAYGAKGMPPTIPSNSALVFEVELKGVQ